MDFYATPDTSQADSSSQELNPTHREPTQYPLTHVQRGNAKVETSLLAHGRCSSLAEVVLLRLGFGDTLVENGGIFGLCFVSLGPSEEGGGNVRQNPWSSQHYDASRPDGDACVGDVAG